MDLLKTWNTYSILRNPKTGRKDKRDVKIKIFLNFFLFLIFLEFKSKSFVCEELVNYRRRLDGIKNVAEMLLNSLKSSTEETEMLHSILNQLKVLQLYVKNADSLNTGGCFEWVDSKIVKSLKDGHYILLENVNLCSSAVLDRLNSVFEPGGSLMLSEKGVTDNEKAEVVKKSKNFRAFLTLDPKNGEISRAMRNRCVEIFSNSAVLNLDDKRKLLFNEGVRDINAINCIIAIHDGISNFTEVNNFSVSHLTQTGFLCAAYKRIGYQMEKAIYISALEVYVYSTVVDLLGYGLSYYRNKLKEIIIMELDAFNKMENTCENNYLPDVILNSSNLTEMKLVKLQTVPIKIIIDNLSQPQQIKTALSQILSNFENLNMDEVNFNDFIKYLIYMEYEITSMNDLRFRFLQLENCLKNDGQLLNLSKILNDCIKDFNGDFKSTLPSLPLNMKLFPRIRDYKIKSVDGRKDEELCLSFALIMNMLLKNITQEPVTKLSSISVLTYSQAVAKKVLTDRLNNTFVQQFSEFLLQLEKLLKTKMSDIHIDLKDYIQLITAVLWFNRLLDVSSLNIYINKEFNTDLIDKLILHFKWLNKNLIELISKLMPNFENISPELHDSFNKMTKYITSNQHPLDLRRKLYAEHLMAFQPFYQEEQVRNCLHYYLFIYYNTIQYNYNISTILHGVVS